MGSNEKIVYFSDLGEFKDVLEFASYESFPATGEAGKIYVAKDDNRIYRWSDDSDGYVEISASADAPVTSVNGQDGDVVLTAGDIDYDDGGSGEDTVKDVLDDTYRKDEVNALVQSNAAHYRGYFATWSDVPWDTFLYLEDDDGNRIPGPNDYIAVGDMSDYPDGGDSSSSSDSGSPDTGEYYGAWRMTYSGSWDDHGRDGWHPAFQYNESPLSPQQQAALDSGITSQKVGKLDALPDADTLAGDFAAKQDKLSNTQISAIDSVVDERKTVVTYTDGTTTSLDIVGELTSESIPLIAYASNVVIGTAVTSIGSGVFRNSALTSIKIPNSVTSIMAATFMDCKNIRSMTIGDGVTSIGVSAFYNCSGLTSVTISDRVTSIGVSAFYGCSGLTNATFVSKSLADVQAMANYPWGISDPSIITTWNDASKEWVEGKGYLTVNDVDDTLSEQGKPADAKATGDALAEQSGEITELGNEVIAKYTKPVGGIPANDLEQSVQNALAAIPGKADAADLRYRIAESVENVRLPDSAFPITYIDVTATPQSRTITGADDVEIVAGVGVYRVRDKQSQDSSEGGSYGFAEFDRTTGVYSTSSAPISDLSFNGSATATLVFTHTLADRTVNLITASDETSIDVELPVVQAGYSRDFYIAVACGSTAPTLNEPTGVTLVNAKGEPPDLSLTPSATTVLRFTEVKEADAEADPPEHAVFCVTGGANGGGSLDLSILAEEFSEQSTYEKGDIVQHENELYMCEFAVTTPGQWNAEDWTTASPVLSVLVPMIRGKADRSDLDSKAESEALAPAWISGHAYFKGDHVSYDGLLYECLSTVAGDTVPPDDATHWKLTNLAAPDATLDILSDGRLRVVAADGTPMWTQGYELASESAVALSCEKINKYVFAATTATAFSDSSTYAVGDRVVYGGKVYKCSTAVETAGAWTGATNWDEDPDTQAFALPNAPSGIVGDFVLDVDNTANEVPVMVAISGTLGTDYDLIVEKGRSSVDVLTIEGGALAELYFTMTAFGTAAKPAWRVVRLNVERQVVGS